MNKTVPITAGDDIEPATPDVAETRSRVYGLLSALLMKEITPGLLDALRSEDIADALEELEPGIIHSMEDPEPKKLLNDLAEEYAALFLVPGGIPPYASVRLHGMLNQKPSWEVEEFYKRCGLVVRDEHRILPDHLGMELDFMGYLAAKEAEARRKDGEEQAATWFALQGEFFRNHIDTWAFDFLRDLQRLAFHPFYQGVGSLAIKFLATEKEHLGILEGVKGSRLPKDESASFLDQEEENHE